MKIKYKINIILVLLCTFLYTFTDPSCLGQEPGSEEIVSKINEIMNQDTVEAKVKMTIEFTPDSNLEIA